MCEAVIVGIETILSDDPRLTVKSTYVKEVHQPLRVVLDSDCRTPPNALVVNPDAKTLIVTAPGIEKPFQGDHIEVVSCPLNKQGFIDLNSLLALLSKKGINSILVEGGGTVIWNFLKKRLVDDFFIYISPCVIGGKTTPTVADGEGVAEESQLIQLRIVEVKHLGEGILIHYQLIP
jgi:2,5-diamino-6-(ribosylamino)-4(3H)-pyrimidinone 5'-phosphate reductase